MGPKPSAFSPQALGAGDRIREYNYIMGENVNEVHACKALILDSIALLKKELYERETEQ